MKYIIKDWAGNILNYKGTFERPSHAVPMEFEDFDTAIDWMSEAYKHLSEKEYMEATGDLFIDLKENVDA